VKLIGEAGRKVNDQPLAENYNALLREFSNDNYHEDTNAKESLVYYVEQIDGEPFERSKEMINNVTPNSVLEDGGTVHLYMSSPDAAALDNHTDTTDIVVVQLEGEKEWLLCADPSSASQDYQTTMASSVRGGRGGQDLAMSRKLNGCSTYDDIEMDHLDCKRTVLRPGDALFLPRRTVHSARALSSKYSAHLTFGFNEDTMCWDYQTKQIPSSSTNDNDGDGHRMLQSIDNIPGTNIHCAKVCNSGCDSFWNRSCVRYRIFSCDLGCTTGGYDPCDVCII